MQINLFAWIVKIVSLKLAPGGDIIMVVKNKIFLVKEITDFFFPARRSREGKIVGTSIKELVSRFGRLPQEVENREAGWGWGEQAEGMLVE